MKIACVSSSNRGETDQVLSEVAVDLAKSGSALAGIVKEQTYTSQHDNGCDMKVRVLPNGPVIKITQDLGAGSDACRLDPGAIAEAVARVESQPAANADLFILNKFGPEEIAGRGFVSAIGNAVEQNIPVLDGVGGANQDAFAAFTGGAVETLPADRYSILAWCREAMNHA